MMARSTSLAHLSASLLTAALLAALAPHVRASPPAQALVAPLDRAVLARAERAAEARDYCHEVMRAASAESAPLYRPQVFSRFGLIRESPSAADSVGSARRDLTWNLQAGVDVSPSRMRTGLLIDARARAECRRFEADLRLRALASGVELEVKSALTARAEVLRARLPEAQQRLAESAARLSAAGVSAPAHAATRGRVEQLRRSLAALELAVASSGVGAVPAPLAEASNIFSAVRQSEAEVAELDGKLRASDSVAISLRAGYDDVFGVIQNVPLFAFVNVSLSPAWPWQASQNDASALARQRRVERRIRATRAVLAERLESVQRQIAVLDRRLSEVAAAVAETRARQTELENVDTPAALEFLEELWFEGVELEAEQAHTQSLRQSLVQRRNELLAAESS